MCVPAGWGGGAASLGARGSEARRHRGSLHLSPQPRSARSSSALSLSAAASIPPPQTLAASARRDLAGSFSRRVHPSSSGCGKCNGDEERRGSAPRSGAAAPPARPPAGSCRRRGGPGDPAAPSAALRGCKKKKKKERKNTCCFLVSGEGGNFLYHIRFYFICNLNCLWEHWCMKTYFCTRNLREKVRRWFYF